MLFTHTIDGKASWTRLFQSIDAFAPLIFHILGREARISNLTPGTNAVFRADDLVVKIFAPEQSGFSSGFDYEAELSGLRRANGAGVDAPLVRDAGTVRDAYLFRYIVFDYIEGVSAEEALPSFSLAQKNAFARDLRQNLARLGAPCGGDFSGRFASLCANERWRALSPAFQAERARVLRAETWDAPVFVHGDITKENVLLRPDMRMCLIDFADGGQAPPEYEYPPIIFDLFGFDRALTHAFYEGTEAEVFIARLLRATLLHEYGASFWRDVSERLCGCPEATTLQAHDALMEAFA